MKSSRDRINEAFDCIEIPESLDSLMQQTLRQGRRKGRLTRIMKYASSIAARCV